jgi:hypothetical protein
VAKPSLPLDEQAAPTRRMRGAAVTRRAREIRYMLVYSFLASKCVGVRRIRV